MTTTGMKKIFISDIHLGDARSLVEPNPYNRFRENIGQLASFLEEQIKSTQVEEVVILGDLFDIWVIPTNQDPLDSFQAICDNPKNESVIKALKELAARRKLIYVQGNHDMVMSATEQAETQKCLESNFDGIRYNPDPNDVYRSGTIVGEHGHRYALFNAPNPLTEIPSFLPLGYFLSRLEANRAINGRKEDFLHILKTFVKEYIINRAGPIHDFFIAMANDAKLKKPDLINMKGIAGFPVPSVEAIGKLYDPLFGKWQEKSGNITWRQAVVGDIGQLLLGAIGVYFANGVSDQNIVIFGHTHKAELWKNYDLPLLDHLIRDYLVKHFDKVLDELRHEFPIPDLDIWDGLKANPMWKKIKLPFNLSIKIPCKSIYVNCGTWVDSKPCTYVETQEDIEKKRHYVRLLSYYPTRELLQEEYVKLKK